jgi:hypothetical protein
MPIIVCHVTTGHCVDDARVYHRECCTLARAGYEVHLIIPHERDEMVGPVRVHALPMPKGRLHRLLILPRLAHR